MLVGCSAGFVNNIKIKGSHNAIASGIVAADSIYEKYRNLGKKVENLSGIPVHSY